MIVMVISSLFFLLSYKSIIDTWEYQGLYYYYYNQPMIESITPRQTLLDQATMVNITSTPDLPFGEGNFYFYSKSNFIV